MSHTSNPSPQEDVRSFPRRFRWVSFSVLLLAAFVLVLSGIGSHWLKDDAGRWRISDPELPGVLLYVFKGEQDLSFLTGAGIGVAFLAATLESKEGKILVESGISPPHVPPETPLVAVVRMDSRAQPIFGLSDEVLKSAAAAITRLTASDAIRAVQIDFEAGPLERKPYQTLLSHVRSGLSSSVLISITAPPRWGLEQNWMSEFPIDEAVALLFRDRIENSRLLDGWSENRGAYPSHDRIGIGVTAKQFRNLPPLSNRIYLFSSNPWTKEILPWISRFEWRRRL